jgi:hypothetical protein
MQSDKQAATFPMQYVPPIAGFRFSRTAARRKMPAGRHKLFQSAGETKNDFN